MKKSIEIPGIVEKQHGVANLAFYLAFGEAWKRNFTHFLYAESDCRFRSGSVLAWDTILLRQFEETQDEHKVPLILGGSLMLENPFRSDHETAQRAHALLEKWNPNLGSRDPKERNKPIVCRAQRGTKDNTSMVGCNGAGAIYSVARLRRLFPEIREPNDATILYLAENGLPFDWECAKRIWQRYKAGAFDRVAHLSAMFSSFGDTVSTEDERMAILRSGQCVLIHPCKSAAIE